MKEFTAEEIQNQFEKLPKELQESISSSEIHNKIIEIGKRHNLMIDQLGDLVDQIGLVMLGLVRSSDFVKNTSARLAIDQNTAQEIAEDINKEIFSSIKTRMQEVEKQYSSESTRTQDISALENAGGFKLEPSDEESAGPNDVSEIDKVNILSGIENPPLNKDINRQKGNKAFTEPLADHLLNTASGRSVENIVRNVQSHIPANLPTEPATDSQNTQATAQLNMRTNVPLQPKGPDTYREPIN